MYNHAKNGCVTFLMLGCQNVRIPQKNAELAGWENPGHLCFSNYKSAPEGSYLHVCTMCWRCFVETHVAFSHVPVVHVTGDLASPGYGVVADCAQTATGWWEPV